MTSGSSTTSETTSHPPSIWLRRTEEAEEMKEIFRQQAIKYKVFPIE